MKSHRNAAIAAAMTLIFASGAYAQVNAMTDNAPAPADNTKSNKLDPTDRAATADDQKNDKRDLMLTKKIRSSIIADKSLSTYADNVKIVSVGGHVTLNGVVRSQAEKDSVEAKARAVVRKSKIKNDLKIVPN